MNLRLSSTWVERHRLYRCEDFIDEADLDSTIKGEFKPTRLVSLGAALDRVLERPEDRGCFREAMQMGFTEADLRECLAAVAGPGIPQAKLARDYVVGPDMATVVAKFDRIHGRKVSEFKTRWSAIDIDAYRQSAQTKLYLDVSGADEIEYTVFVFADTERSGIELRDVVRFREHPYPGLHDDCQRFVAGLVEYVHLRGLEAYCQERRAA